MDRSFSPAGFSERRALRAGLRFAPRSGVAGPVCRLAAAAVVPCPAVKPGAERKGGGAADRGISIPVLLFIFVEPFILL